MLKKRERLSRREVEQVLKHGKRIRGALFSISFSGATHTKCAVVVSKRIARNAVTRNKTRRQVYDVLGSLWPNLGNRHLVVFVNQGITQTNITIVKKELSDLLI